MVLQSASVLGIKSTNFLKYRSRRQCFPNIKLTNVCFVLQEAVKQLGSILKTNVRACKALGHPFVVQLGRIYLDMLNVYKVLFLSL